MPVDLVRCPSCGESNSARRETCYQCQQSLHSPPTTAVSTALQYCKNCAHAGPFAPRGKKMAADEVWCDKQDQPKRSNTPGGACYQACFSWGKAEALD